ncbi:type II secretion system minor pseudopilin GspK [Shewanella sp. 202IG2-18]|uniref:type II secretion system minor pseudopilin GspK n=1 Tax=Parashewanella hymeniacidonis TaxID=2807618 RepID=UPI0019600C34|nr:type II secretion system minor pseudopilin GspK [Parashewanella hymeniacidonis]MBM7071113.1 type II secretion system minor pseudopilin GspK [Parashewanella hymeniacidonis]
MTRLYKSILKRQQQGIALIIVLLIVAVVSAVAANITMRNQIAVKRTINLADYDQAYWYAISAEELAKKVLKQDLEDSEGKVHLQQYWAQADVIFPVENGQIKGTISDMRSCFNVNALSVNAPKPSQNNGQQQKKPLAVEQFTDLLINLGMEAFNAEKLAYNIKDYIDDGTQPNPFGGGDAAYESRDVPYRAARTLMSHRSELRAVIGVTQDVYRKLQPYVCAIPGNNQQVLNVNTIKVEHAALLAAMLQNKISVGEAESVINQRSGSGYDEITDFWNTPELSGIAGQNQLLKSAFSVKSEYFLLDAAAKVDDAVFRLESVLKVGKNNVVDVLTRQYGGQK